MNPPFSQVEHIALEITERASDLLETDVSLVDTQGHVIASSGSKVSRGRDSRHTPIDSTASIEFPLRVGSFECTAIVREQEAHDVASSHLTKALFDMLIDQVLVAQDALSAPAVKDSFIHKLLRGTGDDEDLLLREAQILGLDLSHPRAVILIDAAEFILQGSESGDLSEAQIRHRAQIITQSAVGFFTLPNATICGYIGDGEVVILKASSTRDLAPWTSTADQRDVIADTWANLAALKHACEALHLRLQRDTKQRITIGVGRYHPGISGLSRSYQDARVALSLGRHFHGEDQVHCLNNLGLAAFVGVTDTITKYELAEFLLRPLEHEPEMMLTLETFFSENCCPSSTAQRLSVHRNTLSYRLHKITSLIGLNPNRFEDAVQIRLALALRSMRNQLDWADAQ